MSQGRDRRKPDEVLFSTVRVNGEAVSVRLYVGAKDGGRERVVICEGEPGKISRVIAVDASRD